MVTVRVIWIREGQNEYVAWVDEPHQFEVRIHSCKDDMLAAIGWWCARRGVQPDYYDMTKVKKDVKEESAARLVAAQNTQEDDDAAWSD